MEREKRLELERKVATLDKRLGKGYYKSRKEIGVRKERARLQSLLDCERK